MSLDIPNNLLLSNREPWADYCLVTATIQMPSIMHDNYSRLIWSSFTLMAWPFILDSCPSLPRRTTHFLCIRPTINGYKYDYQSGFIRLALNSEVYLPSNISLKSRIFHPIYSLDFLHKLIEICWRIMANPGIHMSLISVAFKEEIRPFHDRIVSLCLTNTEQNI